jgi:hypothetical protein
VAFPQLNTADLGGSVRLLFQWLRTKPHLDAELVKGVALVSGVTLPVPHRLGREPSGWAIVRKRGFADIKDLQDSNLSPGLTLALQSNANVTVDLLVFA